MSKEKPPLVKTRSYVIGTIVRDDVMIVITIKSGERGVLRPNLQKKNKEINFLE